MKLPRSILRNEGGAAAAEFALVLPVALLLLLGTFDIGRYFWLMNEMEKAVQVGTRFAVATKVVPSGLNAESYVGFDCPGGALQAGDTICREALGTITCTSGGCNCAPNQDGGGADIAGSCPADLGTPDTAAFDAVVRRMQVIYAGVAPGNVRIKYSGSGIGYAGDPREDDAGDPLSEISPIVTVEVASVRFRSISLLGLGIQLPSFRYSQTLEDGDGAIAY